MAGFQIVADGAQIVEAVFKVAVRVRLKENMGQLFPRGVEIIEIGQLEAQVAVEFRLGRKGGVGAGNVDLATEFVPLKAHVNESAKARFFQPGMDQADELGDPFLLHVGGFSHIFRPLAQHLGGDEARRLGPRAVVEHGGGIVRCLAGNEAFGEIAFGIGNFFKGPGQGTGARNKFRGDG